MSAGETDLIASLAVWKAQAIARLTALEAVLAAAVVRVGKGHSRTCDAIGFDGDYSGEPCSCGHDALAAAVGKAKDGCE